MKTFGFLFLTVLGLGSAASAAELKPFYIISPNQRVYNSQGLHFIENEEVYNIAVTDPDSKSYPKEYHIEKWSREKLIDTIQRNVKEYLADPEFSYSEKMLKIYKGFTWAAPEFSRTHGGHSDLSWSSSSTVPPFLMDILFSEVSQNGSSALSSIVNDPEALDTLLFRDIRIYEAFPRSTKAPVEFYMAYLRTSHSKSEFLIKAATLANVHIGRNLPAYGEPVPMSFDSPEAVAMRRVGLEFYPRTFAWIGELNSAFYNYPTRYEVYSTAPAVDSMVRDFFHLAANNNEYISYDGDLKVKALNSPCDAIKNMSLRAITPK